MVKQVYMPLMDEGASVWRPVPAWQIDRETFIVLRPEGYDPDDEKWQFPPGSTVVCEPKTLPDGTVLAAVRVKEVGRQSA